MNTTISARQASEILGVSRLTLKRLQGKGMIERATNGVEASPGLRYRYPLQAVLTLKNTLNGGYDLKALKGPRKDKGLTRYQTLKVQIAAIDARMAAIAERLGI